MTEEHHVHFNESSDGVKTNEIVVKEKRDKVEVQLGFLQVHHQYEVSFVLRRAVVPGPQLAAVTQRDLPVPNLNCRLRSLAEAGPGLVALTLGFRAVKEKLMREKLVLEGGGGEEEGVVGELVLEVVARVLGRGKGTPMLRDGIKCEQVMPEFDGTETEGSDWQGF